MRLESLPEGTTAQLFRIPPVGNRLSEPLFSSSGRWLHPLFELEAFLTAHPISASELFLRDRVIGTAAAFLILRLGIREVESDIASRRALELLRDSGVAVEAKTCIEAIGCLTEQLLKDETNSDAAYQMLCERRTKALAPSSN